MGAMFRGAKCFNGDVSSWDVSQVRVMDGMFKGASSFNQVLVGWNVSHVVMRKNMFSGSGYNQPSLAWDCEYLSEASVASTSEEHSQW